MTGAGPEERLTGPQAAARAGISYNAWKLARRTRGGRPPPDGRTLGRDWWLPATIDAWRESRPPTHLQIVQDAPGARDRVSYPTIRRHLKFHQTRKCLCYTRRKGGRI